MSQSDNERNMSEQDEQQVASEVSSMSQQNGNNEPQFKKELIIHKVISAISLVTERHAVRDVRVQQRGPHAGELVAGGAERECGCGVCGVQYSAPVGGEDELENPDGDAGHE